MKLLKKIKQQFYWERILIAILMVLVAVIFILGIICGVLEIQKRILLNQQIKVEHYIPEPTKEELLDSYKIIMLEPTEEELKKQKLIEYTNKNYKVGDRIKFFDTERVVRQYDSYRLNIIGIGTITKIVDEKIFTDFSENYITCEDATWGKVRSSREWNDLVKLELKGMLGGKE